MEGLGKAVEGLGKAVEGQGKAVEGLGKAVEGLGKAVEGQGKAVEKAVAHPRRGSRRTDLGDQHLRRSHIRNNVSNAMESQRNMDVITSLDVIPRTSRCA